MENDITKLNSSELLEVSGGMEIDPKRSWARGINPIDPESGKQEKDGVENKVHSEAEKVEDSPEEG